MHIAIVRFSSLCSCISLLTFLGLGSGPACFLSEVDINPFDGSNPSSTSPPAPQTPPPGVTPVYVDQTTGRAVYNRFSYEPNLAQFYSNPAYPVNTAIFVAPAQAATCVPKRSFSISKGQKFTIEGPAFGHGMDEQLNQMLNDPTINGSILEDPNYKPGYQRTVHWLMFPTRIDNRYPEEFHVNNNFLTSQIDVYDDSCIQYITDQFNALSQLILDYMEGRQPYSVCENYPSMYDALVCNTHSFRDDGIDCNYFVK